MKFWKACKKAGPAFTALLMLLCMEARSRAEDLPAAGVTFSLSECLMILVVLCGIVLFTRAWKSLSPYLDSLGLRIDAEAAVRCAEAVMGRGQGEEKWNLAMEKLDRLGWNTEADQVRSALKAAWQILNMGMITSGEKIPSGQMMYTPPVSRSYAGETEEDKDGEEKEAT